MHAVTVLENGFDTNPYLHGSLIGINLLLLISLIIRFEWPLIVKKCGKKKSKNNHNINNDNNNNNNIYNRDEKEFQSRSNLVIPRASVQTISQTQSPKESNDQYQYLTMNEEETKNGNKSKLIGINRETTHNTLGIDINTNPSTPSATPTPVPNTPDNINLNNNNNNNNNKKSMRQKPRSSFPDIIESNTNHPPLDPLPSGSKIGDIQLTKVRSGRDINEILDDDQKYDLFPNRERTEMGIMNRSLAEDTLRNLKSISVNAFKNECISDKRRRASIEFYRQLFNVHNFDNNGKLLTAKKRKKRRSKLKRKRKRISYRNDSANLQEHQRSFNIQMINNDDIDDIDDIDNYDENNMISLFDDEPQIKYRNDSYEQELELNMSNNNNNNNNSSTTNLMAQLLNSKIYDDEDKKSVRNRYRYILYIPILIFIIFGTSILVLSSYDNDNNDILYYRYIMFGYPGLQLILSIVLWCEIDIVILSCGGSHIVEECLEVQISANGHEYKCIYCCWCDCAVLRFCNSCTHDNGYSLFKCHHKFMKILICIICPILTIVYYIISEIPIIRNQLNKIEMCQINNSCNNDDISSILHTSLYWWIFIIVSILYIILIFTATYIGILIVKSLHFVSSLSPQTLIKQYLTSTIITFIMQLQFVILLLYYNLTQSKETIQSEDGLCSATPFYLLLIYTEFIIASILNHFAFQNQDFIKFGREAIKKNEVQLFDFLPDYNEIHDLHNYRRVYGDKFLWDLDHRNIPFAISDNDDDDEDDDDDDDDNGDKNNNRDNNDNNNNDDDDGHHSTKHPKTKRKKSKKKKITTPFITKDGDVMLSEDAGRPSSTRHRKKSHAKKSKKNSSKNILKKKSKSNIHKESKQEQEEEEEEEVEQQQKEQKKRVQIALESVIDDEEEEDIDKTMKSRPASTRKDNNDNNNSNSNNNNNTSNNSNDSLSLSFQNATLTQTTQKETGHHHPTTTTSLSLDDKEIVQYSLHEGNEAHSSSFDDNHSSEDEEVSSSKEKSKKKKYQKDKSSKITKLKDKKLKSNGKLQKENSNLHSNEAESIVRMESTNSEIP